MDFFTPLVIGFFGSLHCVGMCGPIALSLPLGNKSNYTFWFRSLQYNFGRVITYGLLGGVFGGLGYGFKIAGLQQFISIFFGIVMIVSVVVTSSLTPLNKAKTFFNGTFQFVKNKLSKLLVNKRASSLIFIGLLNGLLPCGLVYLGIAGAISTGDFKGGASYMMLFGLGTFPAMLLMFAIKPLLGSSALQKIRRHIPYFIFILGCLFILRGLNMDISYLSPDIDKPVDDIENCEPAVS